MIPGPVIPIPIPIPLRLIPIQIPIPVTLALIPMPIPVTLTMIPIQSLGFPSMKTYYFNDLVFDALCKMFICVTIYTASCASQ